MRKTIARSLFSLVMCLVPIFVVAEEIMIENFEAQPEKRWRFFTDSVMGGVSTGKVDFVTENGKKHARLTGHVSTENNGGFIQIRTDLPGAAPDGAVGVRALVRGNDQEYFVHLRTAGTVLPWQYFQAGFTAGTEWKEIRLPFTSFQASGRLLRSVPSADSLKSAAIVAYGRDHDAEIEISEIGFY